MRILVSDEVFVTDLIEHNKNDPIIKELMRLWDCKFEDIALKWDVNANRMRAILRKEK